MRSVISTRASITVYARRCKQPQAGGRRAAGRAPVSTDVIMGMIHASGGRRAPSRHADPTERDDPHQRCGAWHVRRDAGNQRGKERRLPELPDHPPARSRRDHEADGAVESGPGSPSDVAASIGLPQGINGRHCDSHKQDHFGAYAPCAPRCSASLSGRAAPAHDARALDGDHQRRVASLSRSLAHALGGGGRKRRPICPRAMTWPWPWG